ncbi:MAG: SusC/RagA family TonB-linked outer membrane protein [Prevotellaceae bacterium]|jgi:TonB-linked SusC/RagA family outer membrane protein|nr:SusC/RagA family TonB-linked outer membrane protein [Prevotellaceae bacterium]
MRKLFVLLAVLCTAAGLANAQSRKISGTVYYSGSNTPVAGVSVIVKGTTVGINSSSDGTFTINVPVSSKILQFSLVGLKTAEIEASDGMVVYLENDNEELDEIVVTAMGISREKKALGYATSSISGDDIAGLKTVNPIAALQGRVAGLDISSSSSPGGTQNVNIRGFNVLNRASQPLYIVDGVPLTNEQNQAGNILQAVNALNSQADFGSGINALNPNDIENITVLKGSAASALYGSRAAQGVVMITTKSGKNTDGKIKVEYNGGVSIQQIGRLPTEQTLFGQGWSGDRALDENGNWGARFDGKDRVWGNVIDGEQRIKPYVYLKDRIRDFYDLGVGYNNSLSLSGGTENTRYHISVSQNHLDGPIPTDADSYNRYTIASNASHKTKRVTLSSSFNFSYEKNKVSPTGQDNSIYRSLNEIATDISIVDLKDFYNKFNNLDNYFTKYGINPYYVLSIKDATQSKFKFFGKAQIDYNLFNNLKLTYRFGGDFESSIADMHIDAIHFNPDTPNAGSSDENPGNYSQKRIQRIQTNHDLFVSYNTSFSDFSLNIMGGVNANESSYNAIEGEITSIDIPGFYDFTNSLSPALARQSSNLYRIVGAYLNADIGYKYFLYLTLTARNDRSSTLPLDNNSYFYPASMLSFIVSDFLKQRDINTGILDFAKLRAAYGRTGKDASRYGVYNQYVSGAALNPGYPGVDDLTFPLGGLNAYTVDNTAGNPNLKPELTDEFEIGFETQLFGQRLGFDISYYNKFTKGLIDVLPLDPTTGYTWQVSNLGDVRNSGIELSVSLTPLRFKDFQWDIAWNYTKNRNMVEHLAAEEIYLGGYTGMGIYAVEGKAIGQFKSQKAQKVTLDGKEYIVVDGSGNPQPTPDDEYLDKDINEKYRMGLTNTFSWKGISLSGTFDFRYGGSIFSYTKDYMHWVGSGPETVYNDRNPFIIPNSVVKNSDGTYSENTTPVNPTALHTFYSNGGFNYADHAVFDRSYLKLRNVSLAYQLPQSLCSKLKIAALRLSLTASNILLWTPKENQYIDPEVTTFGNDISAKFGEFGLTPPYRTYVFGVSLSF